MRAMKAALTGTLSLVLLVCSAISAAAQSMAEPEYAAIAGTAVAVSQIGQQRSEYSEALPEVHVQGYDWWLEVATDDPRLTGRYLTAQNYVLVRRNDDFSGALRSGRGRLFADDGSWAAEFRGFTKPGANVHVGNHYVSYLTGEGGYEGLTAMLLFLPSGPRAWTVDGVIIPGAMPAAPSDLPVE